MQYSPKLKKAMNEILEILMKYDIAGTCVIHTPGHAEYLNHITPSYSCAQIDKAAGKFTLKASKIHFTNEAERLNKLRDTANMLVLLTEASLVNTEMLAAASETTDQFLGAKHGDSNHTTDTTQNN